MKRLSTMQLMPGMVLGADVLNMDETVILSEGTVLTDRLITKLEMYGIQTVSVRSSSPASEEPGTVSDSASSSYTRRIRNTAAFHQFSREYSRNLDLFQQTINAVVERNLPLDVDELLARALNISALGSNPNSVLAMLNSMREYDDSTYAHCINVALLCNIFAGWLRFDAREIRLATSSGLLHDVGKLKVPHNILTKPARLTEDEYSEIQKHPIDGYQLLEQQKVDIHIQNAALMHHERMDGSGYPLHYRGSQIDKYARLVAIADVYDAMTAKRVYRGPLCPFRVIELFESEGFQKYDVEYLLVILENIVNTYIQTPCRLSDGREGDIIYINRSNLSRPIVQCGAKCVDLSEHPSLSVETLL